jgi:predicted RNA binding protein YcfA (HicA-like mRNA interferase family)
MGKYEKLIEKILIGKSDHNIDFNDLVNLLLNLGFDQRIKGSHHIFYKEDIEEIINIQPTGNKAKPYQVKQIRNMIIYYQLELKANENE